VHRGAGLTEAGVRFRDEAEMTYSRAGKDWIIIDHTDGLLLCVAERWASALCGKQSKTLGAMGLPSFRSARLRRLRSNAIQSHRMFFPNEAAARRP
jgi:hypothetical protein